MHEVLYGKLLSRSEPKELRIKLDRLFVKLDEYYPDKIVIGLHNDHKKLGERITAMYRALGYPDYQSFWSPMATM